MFVLDTVDGVVKKDPDKEVIKKDESMANSMSEKLRKVLETKPENNFLLKDGLNNIIESKTSSKTESLEPQEVVEDVVNEVEIGTSGIEEVEVCTSEDIKVKDEPMEIDGNENVGTPSAEDGRSMDSVISESLIHETSNEGLQGYDSSSMDAVSNLKRPFSSDLITNNQDSKSSITDGGSDSNSVTDNHISDDNSQSAVQNKNNSCVSDSLDLVNEKSDTPVERIKSQCKSEGDSDCGVCIVTTTTTTTTTTTKQVHAVDGVVRTLKAVETAAHVMKTTTR